MAIDYEMLRDLRRGQPQRGDWDAKEAEAVSRTRAEFRQQRECEQHSRDCQAFAKFCALKIGECQKRGDEGRVKDWTAAKASIQRGNWPVSKTVSSDPAVTAYQSVRTRLLFAGKTERIDV